MKAQDITAISAVLPSSEAAECLLELLDADAFTPTVWEDIETGIVRLDIYLEDAAQADEVEAAVRATAELAGVTVQLTREVLPAADWSEAWKRFFHVESITERITIRPSWEAYTARADEVVITLDPGMSFGTGKHPTTRACLEFLDRLAVGDLTRPVLDMGCGSGILSIAAKKLGFTHVRGFDYDADAVTVARENAELNGVVVPYETRDLANNLDQGAVVLANILGPVLIEYAAEVACAVLPGGALVASGILDTLYPEVKAAFECYGLQEEQTRLIGEWRSGLFKRPEEV
ncbi:MAG: 50S ribosomal protein L11 methyltransferase [Kiritimatiellae bacterium]|nr:50S ribosomal protein L11 methyltransferase [Kiritimatiellia bacterium]